MFWYISGFKIGIFKIRNVIFLFQNLVYLLLDQNSSVVLRKSCWLMRSWRLQMEKVLKESRNWFRWCVCFVFVSLLWFAICFQHCFANYYLRSDRQSFGSAKQDSCPAYRRYPCSADRHRDWCRGGFLMIAVSQLFDCSLKTILSTF